MKAPPQHVQRHRHLLHRDVLHGVLVVLVSLVTASGHEGHQPLPTKGVQVDVQAGHLTLSRAARDVLDIRTVEVESGHVTGVMRAYASVVPPWTQHAYVTSRLPGRIVRLNIQPGDFVEAGQVIAELDSLDLHTLRLDYKKANIDLTLSGSILESLTSIAETGAVARRQLAEAENTHRQNQNTLDVLNAKAAGLRVSEAELNTAADADTPPLRLSIASPIRGVVVHADVAVGRFVEPTEHLFEIIDTSKVWVKVSVLERDLYRVQEEQAVRVRFNGLPDQTFETRVDKVGLLLDPLTHQGAAWAEIVNAGKQPRVLPGMTGQAELLQTGRSQSQLVPTAAVFSDGAERYVFVEETLTRTGSEFRKKSVVIGRQDRDVSEVISGSVYPGDRVVTQGGHELSSLFFLGVLRLSADTAGSIGLKVEPVSEHSVERILTFDGAIDIPPQRRTSASSQLAGTLRAIHVDRGQAAKEGDVLAEVASLELQDIQLELLKAQLDGALWRNTFKRLDSIGGAVPRRTVLETEARATLLETQFASLRQKLLTLGLSALQIDEVVQSRRVVDALPIRAPIDGVVVHFDRVLGQVIRADEPLFEIHDLSQSRVQTFVGERDSAQVAVGQKARIRLVADPDFNMQGTVARIGPVVDASSRAQVVWIEFQQPPALHMQHNMLARITVTTESPAPSLAVPTTAVVRDGLRSFVFVQKPDGTFDRRPVTTGRADDRFLEIRHGLRTGELIATGGVPQLQTAFAALR